MGGDLLNQFVDAAGKLTSFGEQDLRNFTQSVDRLFNELGKAVGDAGAFDGSRELLKNSIGDFIHMVQGAVAGAPAGDPALQEAPPGVPGTPPPPGGPQPGGIDFQKFYDETTKKFDEALASFMQSMMADAQKSMQEYQQSFFDVLAKKKDEAEAAAPGDKGTPLLKDLLLPPKDAGGKAG